MEQLPSRCSIRVVMALLLFFWRRGQGGLLSSFFHLRRSIPQHKLQNVGAAEQSSNGDFKVVTCFTLNHTLSHNMQSKALHYTA